MLQFTHSARSIVGNALAGLIEPPDNITPSQWAAKHLTVPDGPRSGEKWDPELTPYVVEPLDNMGPDSPVNKQVIRKSAQTGFTVMAIGGVGHSIDCDPAGGMMLVQPTQDALDKFIRDKFTPAIEQSPALKAKVAPQTARSGEGSTTYNRRYPGGSLALVIANSTASLRSITKKRRIKDEASEYPDDLDGQGSPHAMIDARGESFLADGDWKETNISTPTVLGSCYVDAEFKKGDQRFWQVPCPGCGARFRFEFGPRFKFQPTFPHKAYYEAPCCGTIIEGHEKNGLVKKGEWVATAEGAGKFRSYHIDTLSSPFVPWDTIAARWIDAQSSPSLLRAFYNLTLGLAYEVKGDAPDHALLMQRREEYKKRAIPPRGLMLTGFADVQMRGIYYEIVAWAPNRESWVIDADVIAGDTSDHKRGAFALLDQVYGRQYPDAFGGLRTVDAFGVDSGFRSNTVYAWCADRAKAFATKGVDGWSRPAMGMPSLQDIDLDGHKLPHGVKLYAIGTWPLKGNWYEDLRRDGAAAGRECDPPGYCHFGKFLDENYFKQVTSEYLAERRNRGRSVKAWEIRGKEDNHWLDCRIGNMALADHLGLSRMTEEEWKMLARERAGSLVNQGDLFAPRPLQVQLATAAQPINPAQSDETEPGIAATADVPASQSPAVSSSAEVSEPAPPEAAAMQTDDATSARAQPASPSPASPAQSPEPARSNWLGRDTAGWLDRG